MKIIKLSNLLGNRIYKMKDRRSIRRKIAQREFEKNYENINNMSKEFAKLGASSAKK